MRKLTELLSSPVISLYESKLEGTVKNVIFDKGLKKIKWLVLFNDKDLNEQKYLPVNSIYTVGENAIVIKNNEQMVPNLSDASLLSSNPINNSIFTTAGKLVGQVVEAEIDDKLNLVNVTLNNKKVLKSEEIARSGSDTLIIQEKGKPVKISNMRKKGFPKIDENAKKQKVTVMEVNMKENNEVKEKEIETKIEEIKEEIEEITEELETKQEGLEKQVKSIKDAAAQPKPKAETKTPKPKTKKTPAKKPATKKKAPVKKAEVKKEETPTKPKRVTPTFDAVNSRPNKIITNNSFLLKRVATRTVYTFNKEVVVKGGNKITQKVIDKALKTGKLNEIIAYSK